MTKKVGLLGGSFNPAHEGHIHISLEAIKLLGLNEVWWLVSPQNPLKVKDEMASFEERFEHATNITKNYKNEIIISDFEKQNNSNRTYDTLAALHNKHTEIAFIWLMGADNLINFDKWYKWEDIVKMSRIAVFDRANDKEASLNSRAALSFKNSQLDNAAIMGEQPPCWCFLDIEKHPASSTTIRNKTKN